MLREHANLRLNLFDRRLACCCFNRAEIAEC
jgi:hypothetical protein